MPLIVISGFPCSGKTTRAVQLQKYIQNYIITHQEELRSRGVTVNPDIVIVNDESVKWSRNDSCSSPNEEKKFRAAVLSATERFLNKETIVICDAMNYIKGFRYQLYCIARALNTPHCVVHVGAMDDYVKAWNAERIAQNYPTYSPEQLENLIYRYEEPDSKNRWDDPLFTIVSSDPDIGEMFGPQIIDCLLFKKGSAPRMSTIVKPLTETNYVNEMETAIQKISDHILESQRQGFPGGKLVVPNCSIPVMLPSRTIALSEMRRLKRQFMQLNRMHTQINLQKAQNSFIEFLNTNL